MEITCYIRGFTAAQFEADVVFVPFKLSQRSSTAAPRMDKSAIRQS